MSWQLSPLIINLFRQLYMAAIIFIFICCSFSVICAIVESRRYVKGVSFAQAWSIPLGMPILRSTVSELRSGGRSNVSDECTDGDASDGRGWTPLPDDEGKDIHNKLYPVAGWVDDGAVAFSFATPLPLVMSAGGRRASPQRVVQLEHQVLDLTASDLAGQDLERGTANGVQGCRGETGEGKSRDAEGDGGDNEREEVGPRGKAMSGTCGCQGSGEGLLEPLVDESEGNDVVGSGDC
ncbi:unnamed protein product [Choristocarpus tenellus]